VTVNGYAGLMTDFGELNAVAFDMRRIAAVESNPPGTLHGAAPFGQLNLRKGDPVPGERSGDYASIKRFSVSAAGLNRESAAPGKVLRGAVERQFPGGRQVKRDRLVKEGNDIPNLRPHNLEAGREERILVHEVNGPIEQVARCLLVDICRYETDLFVAILEPPFSLIEQDTANGQRSC
jgi:hypothetical protein